MAFPNIKINPKSNTYRAGFKAGGRAVAKQFGPHASRALRKGDGTIMATFNRVMNSLFKLK